MTKGLIFDIRRFSVYDGPGIRTTVFFKGCPLSCWWCHNPESRSAEPEISEKSVTLDGRLFRFSEVTGQEMTVPEVVREIEKDRIFFDESDGGVTLSGGEPMFQPEFLFELLKELKQLRYHVALDTCGYADQDHFERIIPFVDLFLFDIKHTDDPEHIKYTGVSNQLIFSNLRLLIEKQKKTVIRIPIIPGINDSIEKWSSLSTLIPYHPHTLLPSCPPLTLLPYHSLARDKYKRFRITNKLPEMQDLKKEDLNTLKSDLEKMGFNVKIGG